MTHEHNCISCNQPFACGEPICAPEMEPKWRFNVACETCVHEDLLMQQYQNRMRRRVIVFDMDGTLSNPDERLHFVDQRAKKPDWKAFYADALNDPPHMPIVRWALTCQQTHELVVISGRPEKYHGDTVLWLRVFGVRPRALFMRANDDYRSDTELKEEIAVCDIGLDNIAFAVDDRPRLIEMWRKIGVRVFPVNQNRWE